VRSERGVDGGCAYDGADAGANFEKPFLL